MERYPNTEGGESQNQPATSAGLDQERADYEQRAARFARAVELGFNREDAVSYAEFDDLMDAARQMASAGGDSAQAPDTVEAASSAETELEPPPRIFISRADRQSSTTDSLSGLWLDAEADPEDLRAVVDVFLSPTVGQPVPEYRITKSSGFHGIAIDEHESLEAVTQLARGIAEHGRPFAMFVDDFGVDPFVMNSFSNHYVGSWPTIERWAEQHAEDMGWWDQLNEHADPMLLSNLRVNYERLGRELTYDHHVITDDQTSQVHVFRLNA